MRPEQKQQEMDEDVRKSGFLSFVAYSVDNSSFAFYLAFIGVIIQFVHNLLAFAGTLGLFGTGITLLVVGEWILALALAYFLGMSLFYFTVKAGSVNEIEDKEERNHKRKKYNRIVIAFSVFDTFIDYYFWSFIVFMEGDISKQIDLWQSMTDSIIVTIVIVSIVIMLPQTLRLYTGEIQFKKHI